MASILLLTTTLLISSLFFFFFFFSIAKKKDKNKAVQPPLPPCPKGWPILGNLPQLGSKPHKTLHALSKIYGPLFRLKMGSVTIIVASSADVASQFLRTLDANFSNRPPNCAAEHIAYNYQSLVFSPYGPRWRMLRRLFTVHLFSPKVLDDLRYVREEEVALLASKLRRAQGAAIEVGKLVNICVTNALTRVAMGRRLFEEEKEGPDTEEFKRMVVELMQLSAAFNVEDFIPWLKALDVRGAMRKMKRVHRWYDEIFNKILEERKMMLERGGGGGDFLSLLLGFKRDDNADEETKLTDMEIKALLMDLFTAGTDSTSSTVEWALAELLRKPDILVAVQKELDSIVGKSRLVSELDLTNSVPLLHAIIKETFRLHPPGPLSVPRISSEPCEVSGFHIPEGSTLLVNIWSISRDPEVWNSPIEFNPARFLPGGKHVDVDLKGIHFELIPFGSGRRICAGMRLGLRMVTLMVASLVHGFDWVLPDGQTPETLDMEEDFGLTIERTVPLVARPIPRLDREAYLD
ncbi:hypothetical protein J5N97_010231 [Dioscorea zingiberensis]|uniref:Flavonoid 3'-monooxygenase n=1 Tax=Dioscorea zingiberensis TaxID=325984 RepID=A0A9D5HMK9_9LILI|nr:hypothetical protein J5N97_010231 [Dioscorea zingiberensis]